MNLLNGPTEEQFRRIKEELNENEDRLTHNLEQLKTWMSYQEHLPKDYDRRILPIFLRGCKHDLVRAKKKIELYFIMKTNMPELFANRDTLSKECLMASKTMAAVPLKNLNTDGSRVSVYRLMNSDTSQFNVVEICRLFCILGDIRLTEETAISGDILIMDCGNNVSATHVAKSMHNIIAKGMAVANQAYPQRMKKLHIINLSEYSEKFISLLKSFTKEKIRNRFIIHKKNEDLLNYIDPEILPFEYGGKAGSLASMHEAWQRYLIEKNNWLKEQEGVICTGPIPHHLVHSCGLDSNESIEGSFRKLAID